MAADTASFLDPELSIAPSLSTEDVRQRLRAQGGQTRAATRPSSAAAMGVGPGVGQRGTTTRGGPPGVAAAHAEQFVRMKRSTRSSRPHSADSRLSLAQQAELAQAQAEGWTVSERMHIKNDAIGFIQDGRRFPWQEDRAANNHLKEISPHLATHSSFQELPADEGPLPAVPNRLRNRSSRLTRGVRWAQRMRTGWRRRWTWSTPRTSLSRGSGTCGRRGAPTAGG